VIFITTLVIFIIHVTRLLYYIDGGFGGQGIHVISLEYCTIS
jgi:hypothetical protein